MRRCIRLTGSLREPLRSAPTSITYRDLLRAEAGDSE